MKLLIVATAAVISFSAHAADSFGDREQRIGAVFSLQAAAEKCQFKVDDRALETWMRVGDPFTATEMGLINLMSVYYSAMVANTTPAQCEEWRRIAGKEGWLIE